MRLESDPMPKRDPHTIAVLAFGVVVLLVAVVTLNRVFGAADALAAEFREDAAVSVSTVSAGGTVKVEIPPGTSPSEIVERLAAVGVAAEEETLHTLILMTGSGPGLPAGP